MSEYVMLVQLVDTLGNVSNAVTIADVWQDIAWYVQFALNIWYVAKSIPTLY